MTTDTTPIPTPVLQQAIAAAADGYLVVIAAPGSVALPAFGTCRDLVAGDQEVQKVLRSNGREGIYWWNGGRLLLRRTEGSYRGVSADLLVTTLDSSDPDRWASLIAGMLGTRGTLMRAEKGYVAEPVGSVE